jgi:DNA-binding GntR family transcriptional regulator
LDLIRATGLLAATVKRALGFLRDDGVIFSVPGRGTFVTGRNPA